MWEGSGGVRVQGEFDSLSKVHDRLVKCRALLVCVFFVVYCMNAAHAEMDGHLDDCVADTG